MKQLILIKYGELTTKKENRITFLNALEKFLKTKLSEDITIVKEYSRMYLEFDRCDQEKVISVLQHTFGIHSFHLAYPVHTNIEEIQKAILEKLKDMTFTTFKIEVKRRDKSFPFSSIELNPMFGGYLLKNLKNKKVDVHNPEQTIHIEINKETTYFYFNEQLGLGGYPVGTQRNGLLMLSGGIDSPVAGFLSLKRGVGIDAIYFEALPHTSLNAREKVITLAKKLQKYSFDFSLFVVPITSLQEEIYKKLDQEYLITILRRAMYRIAEQIANKYHHLVLINGESIGQVASQTLDSISCINSVVRMPIIRPVACMDKLEIIEIAKKIDTYDTSILPFEDCCTVFVPKHPVIRPNLKKCEELEKKIDLTRLIDECVANTFQIRITDKKDQSMEDLL